jgi:tRNA 2-selenouridine synthase SelU
MLKSCIVAATLLASFMGTSASANTSIFDQFDANKDGRLTRGEISQQRDQEIIAAMDVNKDGGVTRNEWLQSGRGASFEEKGGVDARGATQRWLEYKIVFFRFDDQDQTIQTQWHGGQAGLAQTTTAAQIAAIQADIDAKFATPPTDFVTRVGR